MLLAASLPALLAGREKERQCAGEGVGKEGNPVLHQQLPEGVCGGSSDGSAASVETNFS